MPTVWITGTDRRRKFHGSPDCRELTKRTTTAILAVDLSELDLPTPCLRCYPDAPRAASFHRHCSVHDSNYPCEHNGGVLVETKLPMGRTTLIYDKGEIVIRKRYVWPERARHYISV